MRTTSMFALMAAVVLAACANQKDPAEKAIANVESSLAAMKADAQQYAADEFKSAEDSLGRLKAKLTSGDYSDVLQGAPALSSAVSTLAQHVAEAKADAAEQAAAAQQEWAALSSSVPTLVQTLQTTVDSMTKNRRFPKGMDKAGFDQAKVEFEAIKTEWAEATAEFGSGQAADAVRRARAAKQRGEYLQQMLGA